MKLSWKLIQERAGGRYAISLAVFLIGSPFWIIGFILNESATYQSPGNAAQVIVITLYGHVIMGAVLLLAHLTLARNRAQKPVSLILMALVWSGAAVARIIAIVHAFELSGLENNLPLSVRIGVSALMAIAGYGLGAYGMDALERFRNERAQILSNLIHSDEQLAAHRAAVETMKEALATSVDSRLKESQRFSTQSLDRLETALTNKTEAGLALEELRSLSEETWRTISQELWAKAPSKPPSLRLSEMLTLFARSDPFRIPFLVTGSAFLFLLVYVRAFEPLAAAVMTVSWLGGIVPLALVFNSVLRKIGHLPKTMFVLMATFFMASSVPVLAVASMLGVSTQSIAQVISVHALTMALTIGSAVLPTIARASQGILDNLKRSFDQATLEKLHIESQLDIASKKLASKLHGDVRGNFLASVLALQKSMEADDVEGARATIDRLRHMLTEPLGSISEVQTSDSEAFAQFLTNWSALVDISLDKPLEDIPPHFFSAVHTIVVDAVNNAVRHGSADWIRISYTLEGEDVILNILNNGRPDSSNRVGLGTLHLNQLAGDMWRRFTNEQGITQLVARLERNRLASLSQRV
jgi:signal transduction histidine kinase